MSKIRRKRVIIKSCLFGCSGMLLGMMLILYLLVLTMCSVPKEIYQPYIEYGAEYYEGILDVSPKITHGKLYADEGGGFEVKVTFTSEQMKKESVKKYTHNKNPLIFKVITNWNDIDEQSKRESVYDDFNRPLYNMYVNLFEFSYYPTINEDKDNEFLSFFNFWRQFLIDYDKLKEKTLDEKNAWLDEQ